MQQELLSTPLIGPLGWFWFIAFLSMVALYIHLWRSSGASNMRKLNRRLAEASAMIGKLQEENLSLQNRNDHLRTTINKIQEERTADRQKLILLAESNDKLRNTVATLSLQVKTHQEKAATYYQRIIALEIAAGIDPNRMS